MRGEFVDNRFGVLELIAFCGLKDVRAHALKRGFEGLVLFDGQLRGAGHPILGSWMSAALCHKPLTRSF